MFGACTRCTAVLVSCILSPFLGDSKFNSYHQERTIYICTLVLNLVLNLVLVCGSLLVVDSYEEVVVRVVLVGTATCSVGLGAW